MGTLILGQYDSDQYFIVTTDGILEPLGVQVLGDSRYTLLPQTQEIVEEIPGVHGEIDFGVKYKTRPLELHVATDEGLTPQQKMQKQREFAKYLDAELGYKKLIFMDDPDVMYEVKYSGVIGYQHYPTCYEFTIPFKAKPFILSSVEHYQSGSGTLVNAGSKPTPVVVEISGPADNPSFILNSNTVEFNSSINSGEKVIINSEKITAVKGTDNVIDNINGKISDLILPPGNTTFSASSNITIRWRDRWI